MIDTHTQTHQLHFGGTYQVHGGVWAKRRFPQGCQGALKFPGQPFGLIQSHRADAGELANHRPPLLTGDLFCVVIQQLKYNTKQTLNLFPHAFAMKI